jgi:23S rRNA pseudouridine1911/1915/1917 synthase
MEERRLELTVTEPQKVETLLRRDLRCSAAVVRTAKGVPDGILLDGVHVRTCDLARPGQVLSILLSDREEGDLQAAPGPVEIVYEDPDILVLHKAAGVAVHPSPGHFDDTLGNFLAYYYKEAGIPFVFRPVNRLDRGTSGLMVAARHAHAQELLKGQLHTGAFRRIYLAVCQGTPEPEQGVVDRPIGRQDGSVLRRQVRPDGARAVTRYQVLKTRSGRALVRLELETGRTHQIRVHMADLGCPLVGDFLYGEEDPALIGRTALHAWQLSLAHPLTGERLEFTAPLPEDMAALIR